MASAKAQVVAGRLDGVLTEKGGSQEENWVKSEGQI